MLVVVQVVLFQVELSLFNIVKISQKPFLLEIFLHNRCLSTNRSGLKRMEDQHLLFTLFLEAPNSTLATCLHVDFHLRTTLLR